MGDFQSLIAKWPSLGTFASDLGVSPNTAAGWYRRSSIPSRYWRRMLRKAAERGISVCADDLIAIAAKAA